MSGRLQARQKAHDRRPEEVQKLVRIKKSLQRATVSSKCAVKVLMATYLRFRHFLGGQLGGDLRKELCKGRFSRAIHFSTILVNVDDFMGY